MKPTEDDYHISAGFGTFHEICPYKEKAEKWEIYLDGGLNNLFDMHERLKKRIKEIRKLLENKDLTSDESMELQYWLRENTMALGEEDK